ncbi:MAG: hypothetical protein AB8B80_01875 [Marinicellaceae bacterium]
MNKVQLSNEKNNALIAFSGTSALCDYVDAFLRKVNDVDQLRDFAINLEKSELKLSLLLMQKALELRPYGKVIQEKLRAYLIQSK